MSIQITLQNGINYDLLDAQIIHKDNGILTIAIPSAFLPREEDERFWVDEPVIVHLSQDISFKAKSWSVTDEVGNVSIIKYYNAESSKEKAKQTLELKAAYELAVKFL